MVAGFAIEQVEKEPTNGENSRHLLHSAVCGAVVARCRDSRGRLYGLPNQTIRGEYYTYLGVRTPLTSGESNLQPFIQVMGAGLGYTFKDNGVNRKAEVQFASPSLGVKFIQGPWNFIGFAGPQFRWKQEDRQTGGRSDENDVGVYLQGEAFYWHEKGNISWHRVVYRFGQFRLEPPQSYKNGPQERTGLLLHLPRLGPRGHGERPVLCESKPAR